MSSTFKDFNAYLMHIREECNFILKVTPGNLTKDEFLKDETLKRAVIREFGDHWRTSKKISTDPIPDTQIVLMFRQFRHSDSSDTPKV